MVDSSSGGADWWWHETDRWALAATGLPSSTPPLLLPFLPPLFELFELLELLELDIQIVHRGRDRKTPERTNSTSIQIFCYENYPCVTCLVS